VRDIDETTGLIRPDIITGGYPCQPFSYAGERRGEEDDRHLWPHFARIIRALKPGWVVGENVNGHISMGLDTVLSDLEGLGYSPEAFVIPACAVDAPHRRDRVWIVAHNNSESIERSLNGSGREGESPATPSGEMDVSDEGSREVMADPSGPRRKTGVSRPHQGEEGNSEEPDYSCGGLFGWEESDFWEPEPGVGRVVDGLSHRVDRLRGLGNAIVPQVAERLFRAINVV
jgi:DNA (cytosine-5)-methyltransferase 1